MDNFECGGWIHIIITEGSDTTLVKFKHKDDHIPYWNIDVPPEIQDYVQENINLNPTQAFIFFNFKQRPQIFLGSFGMLFFKRTLNPHFPGSQFITFGMRI